MFDLVKKPLITALGLAVLTKEKAEEAVKDLVKKGEMSKDEGRQFLENWAKRAEEEKEELRKRIGAETQHFLETTGIATRADVDRLEARIRELEEKLSRFEPRS
ncbi:MAG: polyhydroxyalkanoate synthesis regulator [Firmicutes bacterium]|nr:polyhydroxyalkanoate synthesis regulator [Bacillota bacterium]